MAVDAAGGKALAAELTRPVPPKVIVRRSCGRT
jgi:hypothetical protein